jgi:hypothetical protein
MRGYHLIIIGAMVWIISLSMQDQAKATMRSRYMNLGDKYLQLAEERQLTDDRQPLAIMALACYTAARSE